MLIATIGHQRSGTKLLGSLLLSTGVVDVLGEMFNPELLDQRRFRNYLNEIGLDRAYNRGSFLTMYDYIVSLGTMDRILHFDVMFNQLENACVSWNDLPHPFIYSFIRLTNIFPILLTRDAEDIFVSNKMLQKSSISHQFEGEAPPESMGTLFLQRSEFELFKRELEFHYMMARRVFEGHPHFYELDYAAIAGGRLPDDLFPKIEMNAHVLGQFFNWREFAPVTTTMVKNKPVFEIIWQD